MSAASRSENLAGFEGYPLDELLAVYDNHPLREATVLERIRRQRGNLDGIDEMDLAVDEAGEITDQNHIGGLAATRELARLTGVSRTTRVLDVGCGLGGSARVLAHEYDCRVDGVDLSPSRCADAERLNRRLGLEDRVRILCGDFFSVELPPRAYDVILGQSSFVHFPDAGRLLGRCAELLRPGGRVGFEDSLLAAPPAGEAQREALERLAADWKAFFLPREVWHRALAAASLGLAVEEDLTPRFLAYFRKWVRLAGEQPGGFPDLEIRGWRRAVEMGEAGVVRYVRMVARLGGEASSPPTSPPTPRRAENTSPDGR